MENNAVIRCEKCGSINIELIYKYPNHIHTFPTANAKCTNCGFPSNAISFLSYGVALNDYVEYYSKKHPISCNIDEFKHRVVERVKSQIVISSLFDEKDDIIELKHGFYNFA